MKRVALALAIGALPIAAEAQTPVTVIGPVVAGNCVSFFSATQIKDSGGGCSGGGALLAVNNLSDLNNVATARTNLGLGAVATLGIGVGLTSSGGNLLLANPSASTLGGVQSYVAVANQFLTSISTAGVPVSARPACASLSDSAASCSTDATNASNLSSGSVPTGRFGANTIANTALAQMTAGSVKCNTTNGLANAGDCQIQNLTNYVPNVNNDYVLIYHAATGTLGNSTVGQVATAATAGVTSLNTLVNVLTLAAGAYETVVSGGTTITMATPFMAAMAFGAYGGI